MEERTARNEAKLAMAMPCEEEEEPKAQHDERCKSRPRVFKRKITMKKILYVIIFLCILSACTRRREYRAALSHAQSVIEERPDSSLAILDTLGRHSDDFDEHFRMQYLLELTYAKAKMGHLFDTDSLTKVLVSHFDGNGTCREKALAYYMNGCALCDIGQPPEALHAFYDAIDKADTTRSDCGYGVLRGIYGQMSRIFHKQNLPQDEIWALRHYIECVRRTLSEEDYIIAKGQMIRPYYLLGEKDTVLNIIEEEYQSLRRLGKNKKAVASFATAIHIYTERGQIQKAQKMVDAFERESGLFGVYVDLSGYRAWRRKQSPPFM